MLKKIDYNDKSKSIYVCTKCKCEMNANNRIMISRQYQNKNKKIMDLCKECYKEVIETLKGEIKEKIREMKK